MQHLNLEILTEENKKRIQKPQPASNDFYWDKFRGVDFPTFWSMVGPAKKDGTTGDIYPYEQELLDLIAQGKRYLWIKKATGLGITEFFIRWIAWQALKDDSLQGAQVCIVTGPRIELANTIIQRIKNLFAGHSFKSKETVVELNRCRIEAYPSHHLDTMRGLPNVKIILLDEADFFPPGEQQDARDVSERYIAKSNPYIFMVSTPNLPGGLFESIEKEQNCLYERVFLPYTVGMGHIYSEKEIAIAKQSPSFEREYNLKYGQGIGNIFPYQLVDAITTLYDLNLQNGQKVLAIDPAYGSSKFGIVGCEKLGGVVYVKLAEQHERPSPAAMLEYVSKIAKDYDIVLVDSAHGGLARDLKERGIAASTVVFSKELGNDKEGMVVTTVQAVRGHRVRIHPRFTELQYQLKAVTYNDKGHPDKKKLTFDLGDPFMMAVNHLMRGQVMWADLGRG